MKRIAAIILLMASAPAQAQVSTCFNNGVAVTTIPVTWSPGTGELEPDAPLDKAWFFCRQHRMTTTKASAGFERDWRDCAAVEKKVSIRDKAIAKQEADAAAKKTLDQKRLVTAVALATIREPKKKPRQFI
jgi:hypothetical protein